MAGLYLHIPFCKTRCIYCDFYSTTRDELRTRYVQALVRELEMRADYLEGEPVRTVYLGGGTPSQLTPHELDTIFTAIDRIYGLSEAEEITIEANPDDLTEAYVEALRSLPVNRISMGIQTFDDQMLRLLHRRHTAQQAKEAVARCQHAGFDNLSIDLIYGLPGETSLRWQSDLCQAVELNVAHLSAYHLTYEEGTPLHRLLQQQRVTPVDEEHSIRFFGTLIDTLTVAGYEHYEISNFCRPNHHSCHNSAYWQGIPYLGCGPSAHSYNRTSRQWNTPSLDNYLQAIERNEDCYEIEILDLPTRYNEYLLTALRTRHGIALSEIEERFGTELLSYARPIVQRYLSEGLAETCNGRIRLSRTGIFISDGLISDLMWVG